MSGKAINAIRTFPGEGTLFSRADKADAAIAAAISTLSNLLEARKNGVEVGWRDVDRVVADALDILKGGKAE